MRKLIWPLLLASLAAAPASGQEAVHFLDELQGLSHIQCLEVLEARRLTFKAVKSSAGLDSHTLDFVVESNRLECEMLRVASEITRLEGEQARLAGEIQRLDGLWDAARAVDSSIVDYEGRRRSQELMQADIDRQSQTIGVLTEVVANLRAEARTIFRLAIASAAKAEQRELAIVGAADSADAQNDVLERILGGSRPRLASALRI